MRADRKFTGDDLRLKDPKFQPPRVAQYLAAVERLDRFALERYGKRVIDLAVRWVLDQGITTALWGARRPKQLDPVEEAMGWSLDTAAKVEIDRTLQETITDPVGTEFMAPPEESWPFRQRRVSRSKPAKLSRDPALISFTASGRHAFRRGAEFCAKPGAPTSALGSETGISRDE